MAVYPHSGDWKVKFVPKVASTAMVKDTFVTPDGSGAYTNAAAGSATLGGIWLKTVTSADADYAANTLYPMLVPASPSATFIMDIGTGTGATSLVGTYVDLKDADEADVSASATDVLYYEQFVSTTKMVGSINKLAGQAV